MEPPGPEDVWSDNNNNNNQEETIQATLAEQYPFLHLPQDAPPYLLSSRDFVPRSDLMDRLMSDLGFSETAAKKSLYWTGNHNLDLAMEWLLTRSRLTIETPLEEEVSQLRAELERRDQEQIDTQSSIENPEGTEEEDGDILILNKRLRRRFSSHVWVNFFEDITKDVIYEVSLTRAGSEGLRKWARRPEGVLVGFAESSQHLLDLKLCASSLSLHTELPGVGSGNQVVLAIWGRSDQIDLVVGGLIRSEY